MGRAARAALVVAAASCAACGRPETDILATNSEDVGPWDVANAQVNGDTLTADVCVSRSAVADEVSNRLLLQLRSKGYQRIDLNVYAGQDQSASLQKVNWSPSGGRQMQAAGQASQNPCAAHDAANPAER